MINFSRDWPGQVLAVLFMLVWLPIFGALVLVLFCVRWIAYQLDRAEIRLLFALLLVALFLLVSALIGVQLPLETLVLLSPAVLALYVFLSVLADLTKSEEEDGTR
ncbi:MAG: hypothetical protein IPK17_01610 [Chloroflexi bacterium]|uniref:hypothetical protein n=1 Tax=Candidatus Flexifilum breve TaxID=3140694 RepID=UPI00313647ED|nr:hypothetical protein [Chloroflexota bacterium]